MKISHKYSESQHEFEFEEEDIKERTVEEKEETPESRQAEWEAESCPVHGHGSCHFWCCGECKSTGVTYKQDWSKYQATLKTVKFLERFVICPLCGKEVEIRRDKL